MVTKQRLNALIPRGMRKEVAEKAGVSVPAVTKYLNGQTKESFKIYKAALEIARQCNRELQELESGLILNN